MAQKVILGGNTFWVEDNSPENPLPAILVSALAGLTDVDLTSPQDGDTLGYDAGSGKWVNQEPAGGGDSSGIQVAHVQLTDAQIKALPTTPQTIIAAPGANKVIVPVLATIAFDFQAGAYTNVDPIATLALGKVSGGISIFTLWVAAQLLAHDASPGFGYAGPYSLQNDTVDGLPALSAQGGPALVNEAVQLFVMDNNGQDFTGGNAANGAHVTLWCATLDLATGLPA